MKKLAATAVIAGLVGFIAGNAFFYLASPLWIDREVNEVLPAELMLRMVAKGDFRDADQIHKGSGTATVVETAGGVSILRFSNFKVTNGPDLKVWLVKAEGIEGSADVTASEWLTLGPLKGNIGEQNYVLPEGTDVAAFKSVVIWCEQFSVLFASATLAAGEAGPI